MKRQRRLDVKKDRGCRLLSLKRFPGSSGNAPVARLYLVLAELLLTLHRRNQGWRPFDDIQLYILSLTIHAGQKPDSIPWRRIFVDKATLVIDYLTWTNLDPKSDDRKPSSPPENRQPMAFR